MRAHFGLPSVEKEEVEGRPPIGVKFEIPYFTVSGIQVSVVGSPFSYPLAPSLAGITSPLQPACAILFPTSTFTVSSPTRKPCAVPLARVASSPQNHIVSIPLHRALSHSPVPPPPSPTPAACAKPLTRAMSPHHSPTAPA